MIEKKVYTLPNGDKLNAEVGYSWEFKERDQRRIMQQGFILGISAGLIIARLIALV